MKSLLLILMMCALCFGLQGCTKKFYAPQPVGTPSMDRTPLMIRAQTQTGLLRLYQTRLSQRSNRP